MGSLTVVRTQTMIFIAQPFKIAPAYAGLRACVIVSTNLIYSTTMKKLNWLFQPLALFAAAMLLLLNFLLFAVWYIPALNNLGSATDQLGNSLVRNLAYEATSALHSNNRVSLSNLLTRVGDQENVILATVIANETGNRLSSRTKNTTETGRTFKAPIQFSSELLGYAEVTVSERNIQHWKDRQLTAG